MLLYAIDASAQEPTQDPYPNTPAIAVNINKYSFYIDSIRAINEQTAGFTATNNDVSPANAISLTGVTAGVHQLYAKVTNTNGNPSIINLGNFYMEGGNSAYPNVPATAIDINKYSFYIDSVRTVNEQAINFTAAASNTTPVQAINLTSTTSGVHQLYAKVTNTNGNPSIINLGNFYMEGGNSAYPNVPIAAFDVNKYSFYIDSIRTVNEQAISFAPVSSNLIPAQSINLTGVISGVHQLYAKVINLSGNPSIINLGIFYFEGDNFYRNTPTTAANINRYEFFIDSVKNNALPLSFAATSNNTTSNTPINLTSVLPGTHQLYAKVFDINNKQSIVNLGNFTMDLIYRYTNPSTPAPNLQNMEYYIDTDPGYGLATPIVLSGSNVNETLSNIGIAISTSLSTGTHYLHLRSKQNPWSIDNAIPFDVLVTTPVTWLYVKAQLLNNQTSINWATANETNTSSFEIEWSRDGLSFNKISEANAAGNSSVVTNYNFIHPNPISGFNYYRIKQIDLNGTFKYSIIVKVLQSKNIKQTIIAPNPVINVLNIIQPKSDFIRSITIYDAKGVVVLTKQINEATQVYSIQVGGLPIGNYKITIFTSYKNNTYSFIKQ